jgi:SAM-dependent methyltransferase
MAAPLDATFREGLAPMGRALAAYGQGAPDVSLLVHVEDFPPEVLPVSYFFRAPDAMGAVDRAALGHARGSVLDVGAGAGAHAAPLVAAGHAVTALDLLPEAVRILSERGVADAREESVWSFQPQWRFDTALALMNGTALAGTAGGLLPLLLRLGELIQPHGQILLDSTALEGAEDDMAELHYQLEFAGERGPPFPQLFVGETALKRAAEEAGYSFEVLAREEGRYLARLMKEGARREP